MGQLDESLTLRCMAGCFRTGNASLWFRGSSYNFTPRL